MPRCIEGMRAVLLDLDSGIHPVDEKKGFPHHRASQRFNVKLLKV